MRTMWIDAHELGVNLRDLRRLADERGLTGGPQVITGDDGAELADAPLAALVGDAERRAERRSVRVWLGEPATLGPPVEVLLRRQEGANLLVVTTGDSVGPGHAPRRGGHRGGRATVGALETWVLDLGGLETGFGDGRRRRCGPSRPCGSAVGAGQRRPAGRGGRAGGRTATADGRFDEPPCLFVVNRLGAGPS